MPGRRKKSAFDRCVEDVAARGSAYDPYAVCAAAGVRKYGQREMTRRAIAGKRRAARSNRSTAERELEMERLRLVNEEFNRLRAGSPTRRELELSAEYPRMPRERVLRMVAAEIVGPRSNPYESAAELSEAFHGRPAESVTYIETPLHEHKTLSKLGRLVSIELKDGTELEFDAGTMLSSNEAGSHLFIDGGDQSIDLSLFPECDPTKEACSLGLAEYVTYWTSKQHLGRRDRKPGPYRHKFGDESGDLPELVYDPVNRLLAFVGGHYYIDLDMPGGYSAGIRD